MKSRRGTDGCSGGLIQMGYNHRRSLTKPAFAGSRKQAVFEAYYCRATKTLALWS
ncbi:MAG: hypothetical protein RMJ15_00015 [Nitrososphaerota archaeon]|nr:hypothetical protein [Nitrososphaerota archaeon]